MKPLLQFSRSFFISFELLVVSLLAIAARVYPPPFLWLDKAIAGRDWWQLLVPLGAMIASSLALCWKILFPAKNAHILAQWSRYPLLRITTLCGFLYVSLGTVCAVFGVLGLGSLPGGLSAFLVLAGYSAASISLFTMILAALVIRSLLICGN